MFNISYPLITVNEKTLNQARYSALFRKRPRRIDSRKKIQRSGLTDRCRDNMQTIRS